MSARYRVGSLAFAACLLLCCASCNKQTIPKAICGTPIDPNIARPLVPSFEDWNEYDRVNRVEAITAPCLVLSNGDVMIRLRFSWDEDARSLTYLANNTGSVSGVTAPRRIAASYKAVVGTDGAIATTPCKTKGGEFFTLTLQLPQIKLTDRSHRADIERFMRAYFPATVKTLGCAKAGTRPRI